METWKYKPLVELPGKVCLWETAPVWSLTRGPPSSHTQISSATTCQPGGVKHRQADNIWHILHKLARGRWQGKKQSHSPWLIWHLWRTQTVRSCLSPPAERSEPQTASQTCSVSTTHSEKPSGQSPYLLTSVRWTPPQRRAAHGELAS